MSEIYIEKYKNEEKINVITHLPGVFIGIILTLILVSRDYDQKTLSHIISYIVYGLSFVCVFAASTVYHASKKTNVKNILKKVDHSSIFIFIGGCYTPFVVINMQSEYKFIFLGIVWTLVFFGIIYKFLSQYKSQFLSLTFYFGLAFMCFLAKDPLLDNIPNTSYNFLVLGGVFYGLGTIFYLFEKIPYHHAIWHIFVILGALSHFEAIYLTI